MDEVKGFFLDIQDSTDTICTFGMYVDVNVNILVNPPEPSTSSQSQPPPPQQWTAFSVLQGSDDELG